MLFDPPSDDVLYQALLDRDPAYEGRRYVGVRTTGVFCRLTCPARKPLRRNVVFFCRVEEAMEAGFRACKRCRPLVALAGGNPVLSELLALLDAEPERRWLESDLLALGYDTSTIRRVFKRAFGATFIQLSRARRIGLAAARLSEGGTVIEAQIESGYESGSGFREAFMRMIGEPPARAGSRSLLAADWIETPIGPIVAIVDDHALHLLEFTDRKALPAEVERLQKRTGSAIRLARNDVTAMIERELADYFAGRSAEFRTPLALGGTPFQRTVWDELRRIPLGETRSYRGLARDLGRPEAVRAVAGANGANQLAILIPCHRVIGSDGQLTGYGGKIWRKHWLLEHERGMADEGNAATRMEIAS